jgi:aspartyl aminopeptidase
MALLRLHLLRPPPHPLAAVSTWRRALPAAAPTATASRLLCSSQPAAAPSPSIVGGLLDYLNESWTQFHATGQ